jgi:hypothetical protein
MLMLDYFKQPDDYTNLTKHHILSITHHHQITQVVSAFLENKSFSGLNTKCLVWAILSNRGNDTKMKNNKKNIIISKK